MSRCPCFITRIPVPGHINLGIIFAIPSLYFNRYWSEPMGNLHRFLSRTPGPFLGTICHGSIKSMHGWSHWIQLLSNDQWECFTQEIKPQEVFPININYFIQQKSVLKQLYRVLVDPLVFIGPCVSIIGHWQGFIRNPTPSVLLD